jgi:hypothetical protein
MFRIGGSAGTGITSGLDQPRKQYNTGSNPYAMGNFQSTGLPGFLTSFGLNLLSTPPSGNIFQTAALAAQDPFRRLQADQASAMKTASDRAFAKELAEEERKFISGETTRKLESAERIAGMKTTDTTERIQAIADTKYDGDEIRATREVNFATKTYPNLVEKYGQESVATSVIDSSGLQKPKDIQRFVKQNPQFARQVVYDVRTGKAMRFVKDQTGKFALVPADSADIDTTGEGMPEPESQTPRSFDYLSPGQKKVIEDIQAGADKEFGMGFYD